MKLAIEAQSDQGLVGGLELWRVNEPHVPCIATGALFTRSTENGTGPHQNFVLFSIIEPMWPASEHRMAVAKNATVITE